MSDNNRKTPFVALKVYPEVADQVRQLAEERGMTISAVIDDLIQGAQGYRPTLPAAQAMHEPSRQSGRAEGYAEALADLAERYHMGAVACEMARDSNVDFRQACEFDNRILRQCGVYLPFGCLIRNHKRGPKT